MTCLCLFLFLIYICIAQRRSPQIVRHVRLACTKSFHFSVRFSRSAVLILISIRLSINIVINTVSNWGVVAGPPLLLSREFPSTPHLTCPGKGVFVKEFTTLKDVASEMPRVGVCVSNFNAI